MLVKVPFIKTKSKAMDLAISALELKDNDVVYELGCGDADFLKKASLKNYKAKMVGYEIGKFPYLFARINTRKYVNITIYNKSLFEADLSIPNKIYCYLSTNMMIKLEPIMIEKCKKGTKIISCDFPFPNMKPKETIKTGIRQKLSSEIYVYEI